MLDQSMCPRWVEDFCEIRLHVDFNNRLLVPLGVAGIGYEEAACFDVLLYGRERCHPNCRQTGCPRCRLTVLYKDCAVKPTGTGLAYRPHSEYLYCLKCHQRPATALLSLTPHEQDVEVKELGLLACWFATWFERAKASVSVSTAGQGVSACSDVSRMVPMASAPPPPQQQQQQQQDQQLEQCQPAEQPYQGEEGQGEGGRQGEDEEEEAAYETNQTLTQTVVEATAQAALKLNRFENFSGLNMTSKYLPNMRIIYQVRKERMTVTLPEPSQLTRNIDVQLLCQKEGAERQLQTVSLRPGDEQANGDLIALRDTPYTLMVKIPNMGQPLELLDLVTERKVLRVQESRLAPKFMNFLMERRVDQRATFVLHVTFDEKSIDVSTPWLGEFFLDVDSIQNTLSIGTVNGMERKIYRVEKMLNRQDNAFARSDMRELVFEGGIDPFTMRTNHLLSLDQETDYLISVVDPDTRHVLPTSILSIRSRSLYVKEIKGGDVRLHVTVQRDLPTTNSASSNDNNLQAFALRQHLSSNSANQEPVFQRETDGTFHCPLDGGCARTRYRILHTASRRLLARRSGRAGLRSSSRCSSATAASAAAAATDAALEAAEASTYSCGGGGSGNTSRQDDSGLGRNPASLSEGLDASTAATMHQAGVSLHLDVDLVRLKARLLPTDSEANASNELDADENNGCYLVLEEPRLGGKVRSSPCQLGQEFSISRWSRYTVKAIEECSVSPLFSFRLTDRDVTEVKQCGLQPIHLTQSVTR